MKVKKPLISLWILLRCPRLSPRVPPLPQQQRMVQVLLHLHWPCPTTFAAVHILPPYCPSVKPRPTSVCSLTVFHSQLPLFLSCHLAACLPHRGWYLHIHLSRKHTLPRLGLCAACTTNVQVPSASPLDQPGPSTPPAFTPFFTLSPSWHIRRPGTCPPFPTDCSSRCRRRCHIAVVRPTQLSLSSLIVSPFSGPPLFHSMPPPLLPPDARDGDSFSQKEHRAPQKT